MILGPQLTWTRKMPKAFQGRRRYTENSRIELLPPQGTFGPWFLGIDWGHLPLFKPVYSDPNGQYPIGDHYVEQNTGIACVLPAWHILDLLMKDEDFVKERKKDKEALDRRDGLPRNLSQQRPKNPHPA